MRIKAARVIVCSPGRNFVTLKIETDEGVHGIGDATLNGRELAVVAYLEDHVVPALIGRDARRIEDIWQYLYRGAYWRRGPVTMRAIAAVDMALWDIKAKALGVPLYQLLGGKSRDGVMVYGHANGADIEETADEVARYLDAGLQGRPRADRRAGPDARLRRRPRPRCTTSRPTRPCRPRRSGRHAEYLDHAPKLFERAARAASASIRTCCTTCTTG